MTWIRVDDDVIDHPKTYRLARLLGADRTTAFGLLVAIWGYAARHHVDGDLTDMELAALHARIDWLPEVSAGRPHGGPQDVRYDVRVVLIDAGWADRLDGRIVLHDWDEHQGKLADRRAKDRERKRLQREEERQAVRRTSAGLTKSVRRTSAPTERNDTKTERDGTSSSSREEDVSSAGRPPDTVGHPDRYYIACTVALNNGMYENPTVEGEWIPVSASSQVGRVTWCEDDIPLGIVEEIIVERAKAYRCTAQNRGPRSLKYFDCAVRETWERGQQSASDAKVSEVLSR